MEFLIKSFKIKILIFIVLCLIVVIYIKSRPPSNFPTNHYSFHISKGSSITEITGDLYADNLIRSSTLFKYSAKILSYGNGLRAGDYIFTDKENLFTLISRFISGDQRQSKYRITIPEGTNTTDMALIYLKNIPNFNAPRFLALAKKEEGYLYPDTYDFLENVTAEQIIKTMKDHFNKKILTIDKEIKNFKKPIRDIIIMASIIEKEVKSIEDRKLVSGILWKRLNEGMFLQVDAPFYYLTGKTGGFSTEDLKIDSPYNTYKYKGLPKGPISNPSIDAIKASIDPTVSKYYFYISGKDGKTYYATTYESHLQNIAKYLR